MASDISSSIQKVISDEKPTVRKSIVIGIGGSGMKGILAAKKHNEVNLPNEAYRYMRWVGIDTTDIETSIEGKGGRYRFPTDQFYQEEKRMLYLSSPTPAELSLEFLRDKYKNDKAFNWLPNPDVYDISTRAGQGANQTRALGRLAFFFNEQKIREALIKERDRLNELPDDPKYFQLMDVKEGEKKHEEKIIFKLKSGVNRYYFSDKIPKDNTILSISASPKVISILAPHLQNKLTIDHFPKDERGPYFEVPGHQFDGKKFTFMVKHVSRGGQVSIFITCSIVGGTGNGMILDLVALVKDIFKDSWPKPRVYGILVLPSAFKRVVSNRNARANAYAALKEIDYFMSGNTFNATYPSGRSVRVKDRIFDDGMLYLLDVDNMSGNALQGRDQVQELTGQFISTFVASTVGGSIEERMVNDSTRAAVYLPKDESSKRRASYNSFGISRVIYPVPHLVEIGYKKTALSIVHSFMRPVDNTLLLETMGDLNRGLVRALRLNCRLIFERMYPDYKLDTEVEFRSYRERLKPLLERNDNRKIVSHLENVIRDYGKEEMEKIKKNLLLRMGKRYSLELSKVKTILLNELHNQIKDPNKGFLFAEAVINLLLDKLELYQRKYYSEKIKLARYSQSEMEKLIEKIDSTGLQAPEQAMALIDMADFNFVQLVFESMLTASENFVRDFKATLYQIRNDEIMVLKDKVINLQGVLEEDVSKAEYVLLEKKNPLFFYLINKQEIEKFLNKFFYARLSIEDLCNDVDFVKMDNEDNKQKIVETHLIATEGLSILDMSSNEIKELIEQKFGDILEKSIDEIRARLYSGEDDAEGYALSESSLLKIDIENLEHKLFEIIYSRFSGFNFETISIRDVLAEKKIPLRRLLEKLDHFSRPYLNVDATGLRSVEYYRSITNFKLNTHEEGDDPDSGYENDLPPRLDHYIKRNNALPQISVETFEVPNFCKPYEMISIGILLGFPIFKLTSLNDSVKDYHALIAEKSHPLHLFNNPSLDARYFPDPFRTQNYINPLQLWKGLIGLKALESKNGVFEYEETLHASLKEMQAREDYKKVVLKISKRIEKGGGLENCSIELLVEAINALAMLRKNSQSNKLMFRREYSLIIRDILDGDGTSERAKKEGLNKDQYIEKFIKPPAFDSQDDLTFFLESEYNVRQFLIQNVKDVIESTKATINAGAKISLPKRIVDKIILPKFQDKFAFFDFFERTGSLEWQNYLKEHLVKKLDRVINSARFRLESDPTLIDRNKAANFLEALYGKIPEAVIWEVQVENKLTK